MQAIINHNQLHHQLMFLSTGLTNYLQSTDLVSFRSSFINVFDLQSSTRTSTLYYILSNSSRFWIFHSIFNPTSTDRWLQPSSTLDFHSNKSFFTSSIGSRFDPLQPLPPSISDGLHTTQLPPHTTSMGSLHPTSYSSQVQPLQSHTHLHTHGSESTSSLRSSGIRLSKSFQHSSPLSITNTLTVSSRSFNAEDSLVLV